MSAARAGGATAKATATVNRAKATQPARMGLLGDDIRRLLLSDDGPEAPARRGARHRATTAARPALLYARPGIRVNSGLTASPGDCRRSGARGRRSPAADGRRG